MEVSCVRNIERAELELGSGLNVFCGRNAQGKTTLLESVGLLARGRSFRTEETAAAVQRGAAALRVSGRAREQERETGLEVEVGRHSRRFAVDAHPVTPRAYQGRLEVVVYATDRLKVVRGPMRERRLYLDRNASSLWPTYRQLVNEYEQVLRQRNAALETGSRDLPAWDERFVSLAASLRQRRSAYAARLQAMLATGFKPAGEQYEVATGPEAEASEELARARLERELAERRRDEQRLRRSLVGPHRDPVFLRIDAEDAASGASSGQARSLLLALTLATLEVYRQEHGRAAVALLDDLDSELDEERAFALCRDVAQRGQALVTTAHEGWARALDGHGHSFRVAEGRVASLGVS
jgi:DNA replication and repair protein RecF